MAGKGRDVAFSLKLDADEVRVRKACAPACRAHADRRRKEPRRKPDLLAECDDFRRDA